MPIKITCAHCGKQKSLRTGDVNRALKINAPLYCDRICSGLGRRKNLSVSEKKKLKREYDMGYRAENQDLLKANKKVWFQKTYDPKKAAIERKKNMGQHIEYCRQPEYRAWKKQYDRNYLAQKQFGEFADAALMLRDIESEIDRRMTRYEVYLAKGTLNKHQQRRRDYERLNCNQPEEFSLGNSRKHQER